MPESGVVRSLTVSKGETEIRHLPHRQCEPIQRETTVSV